MLGKMAWLDL